MSVNGINNVAQTYDTQKTSKVTSNQNGTTDKTKQKDIDDTAVVYEKSDASASKDKVYKKDTVTIDKLLAESEKRAKSLTDLVKKMLLKQGETYNEATDIYALLREGKLQVDPEIKAQAQRDIAEGGYWGVAQTSERLLSFAKALTGGDPSKADQMIAAVKKGFDAATKAWGGDLPGISQRTYDATISKLEAWRDSIEGSDDMSSEASDEFAGQAAAEKISE